MAESMTAFCQRVRTGLAHTTFEQQRTLVELLIDRVLVANGDVEIRYAIPTHPRGEMTRFCQLRKDYFHNVVEIFHLADGDRGAMRLVVVANGRGIGLAPINSDRLRDPVTANRFGEETLGGPLVALLGQQKVNRLAVLVYRPIQIPPFTFDADVRLIHAPTDPDGPLAAVKRLLELRAVFDAPPVDGGMIHVDPTFEHEFFDMARAQ